MPAFGKKVYLKDYSRDPIHRGYNKKFLAKSSLLPGFLVVSGFLIFVFQVLFPLVYFKTSDDTVSPLPKGSVLGVATGFTDFEFGELGYVPEGEKPEPVSAVQDALPEYFYLSVPKLNIKDAAVETNSASLNPDKSLGHYKGSSIPGTVGNAFIYGHSVLPFFYNPRNYKTIFSTLDTLKPGDTFYIKYKDKKFDYIVESRAIVAPTLVNPLAEYKPKYLGESTVTLMTCVPPGTREKRLLVYGVMVKPK
jgi:LPXTG-site transpeptidase (sortase) family protein